MSTRIQIRRGTAAAWAAANPVLAQGEPALEQDTDRTKLGDGITPWADLDYRELVFGTAPGTVAAGDDPRITGATTAAAAAEAAALMIAGVTPASIGAATVASVTGKLDAATAIAAYARRHQSVGRRPRVVALPAPQAVPITRATGTMPAGAVQITPQNAAPLVTIKGGKCAILNTAGADAWRNYFGYSEDSSGSPYYVEFDFYGTDLALRFRDNWGGGNAKTWTWIDGVPVTSYAEAMSANSQGVCLNWYLNFGSLGRRRVRVYFYFCDFAGFNVHPTAIIQPVPSSEVKVGIYGDSWIGGANGVLQPHTFLYTAALLLGWEPFIAGQGGTGYMCATGNPMLGAFTDARRLGAMGAVTDLDYLIVEGSLNDDVNSDATPAQITAAATATYAALATSMPNTKLIVFGVQSIGTAAGVGDSNADRIANNTAVKAAADAAPNVLGFVDMLGEHWMTGSGYVGATTGDGAGDYLMASVYHPSQPGHDFLASRAATRIASILVGSN